MEAAVGRYALVDVLAVGEKDALAGPAPQPPGQGEGRVEQAGGEDEDAREKDLEASSLPGGTGA